MSILDSIRDFFGSLLGGQSDQAAGSGISTTMPTRHEGDVPYLLLWNFWVRADKTASVNDAYFFRDYEKTTPEIAQLLAATGVPSQSPSSEKDLWDRIGLLWNWLPAHVCHDPAAYTAMCPVPNGWPSIADFANYYAAHGHLVQSACFSKAHLFASLLGRMGIQRFRLGIAEAHHTEGGAPPTASHAYVAVYVASRWFFFDPGAAGVRQFPAFQKKKSIGMVPSADYEHPHSIFPVPSSSLGNVPHLPP